MIYYSYSIKDTKAGAFGTPDAINNALRKLKEA